MNNQDGMRQLLAALRPDENSAEHNRDSRSVYIINGAPGSGKTTWALQKMAPGDLLVDTDYLCAALCGTAALYTDHEPVLNLALDLSERLYDSIEKRHGKWNNAFVVTASSDKQKVNALVNRLGGQLIQMDTTLDQCISNIENDSRRIGKTELFSNLAREWFWKRNEQV